MTTEASWICLVGYAIAQATICDLMEAGPIEHILGFIGVAPVSLYCTYKDEQENQ